MTRNDVIWAALIAAAFAASGLDALAPRLAPDFVPILWLPTAVLAAAFLRRINRPEALAALCLAAMAGAGVAGGLRQGDSVLGWAMMAAVDCGEAFFFAAVLARVFEGTFSFHRPMTVGLWSGLALAAPILSIAPALLVVSLGAAAPFDLRPFATALPNWILGHAAAYMTVGVLLTALTAPSAGKELAQMRASPRLTALAGMAIMMSGLVAFIGPQLWDAADGGRDHPGYLGLVVPALMWAGFQYGPIMGAAGALVALAPGVIMTVNGSGPFSRAGEDLARDLQILILALSGATLVISVLGAVARDARDRATSADRAKTRFISRIGHELRTPLNGVIGSADLLAEEWADAPPSALDRLDMVRNSARTLARLVEDLVEYAAFHREGVSLRPINFLAAQPVRDAETIFAPRARWNGVEFQVALEGFDGLWVTTDPARLRQALFALTANAVDLTRRGHILIEGRADRLSGDRARLTFVVRDTGPGIAREKHAEVFEPFVQGRAQKGGAGLGIGLAVARQTVDALGGTIRVESAEGEGAAFTICIEAPIARGDDRAEAPVRARALLAEDNPTNRIVLSAMLSAIGLDVVSVETGREALEAVERGDFLLVVMDIEMPEMDGEEAIRRIRRLAGARAQVRIIAVSAHHLPGDENRFLAAGANGFVPKPIERAALSAEIARVLGAADRAPPSRLMG